MLSANSRFYCALECILEVQAMKTHYSSLKSKGNVGYGIVESILGLTYWTSTFWKVKRLGYELASPLTSKDTLIGRKNQLKPHSCPSCHLGKKGTLGYSPTLWLSTRASHTVASLESHHLEHWTPALLAFFSTSSFPFPVLRFVCEGPNVAKTIRGFYQQQLQRPRMLAEQLTNLSSESSEAKNLKKHLPICQKHGKGCCCLFYTGEGFKSPESQRLVSQYAYFKTQRLEPPVL